MTNTPDFITAERPAPPATAPPEESIVAQGPAVPIEPTAEVVTPPTVETARIDPPGQMRAVKRLLIGVLILLGLGAMYFASVMLIPIAAALLINFLFKPVVRRLEAWRVPPPLSALLIIIFVFAAIAGAGYALSGTVSQWVSDAPQNMGKIEKKVQGLTRAMSTVTHATKQAEDMASNSNSDKGDAAKKPVPVEVQKGSIPTGVLSVGTTTLAGLLVMLALSYFLLASGDLLLLQLVQAMPHLHDKREAVQAVRDLEGHVSGYLLTVTAINAGLGVVVALAMWAVGLPNPIMWGVAAAVMNFIPYLGPLIVWVLIFGASILAFNSLGYAVVPPLVFITCTSIEGYGVTPTVLGKRLSLNPLAVFLALLFWGWMWGVAGALMSVPMLVSMKIICDHVESLNWLSHLLSGEVRRPGEGRESTGEQNAAVRG